MHCVTEKINMPFDVSGRTAHLLIYKLKEITSAIRFKVNDREVNAKSLFGILSAPITRGMEVEIACLNDDNDIAIGDLCDTIQVIKNLEVMLNESK